MHLNFDIGKRMVQLIVWNPLDLDVATSGDLTWIVQRRRRTAGRPAGRPLNIRVGKR